MLAEVDLIRDSPLIGLGAFGLFFGAVFLVGALDKKRWVDQTLFQFVLMQVVFVPLAAWMTLWCYQHPERLASTPDAWEYDFRIWGPIYAVVDAWMIVWFIRRRWWNWARRPNG